MKTYHLPRKKNHTKWFIRFFVFLLIIWIIGFLVLRPQNPVFEPNTKIVITKGDSLVKIYQNLPIKQQWKIKRYARGHSAELPNIVPWTYVLSGNYTPEELFVKIAKWPEQSYIKYTVLEGWSIYDIDADLASKGYISAGEYISYVTNMDKIKALSERYDFFDENVASLEGFLYPDTYNISAEADFVKDLVSIQLNTFKSKVWEEYKDKFVASKLGVYGTLILASIVEKEEKKAENKPTVAWIFFNRIDRGMLLWADITLCYNFKKPYSECTPSVIWKNVSDTKNPYNTRQVAGLTPTPIGNPSLETIKAVLSPSHTNYLFYLHGSDGQIHYAETNAGHEENKRFL